MAETEVYSIAELSRCKLLYEASIKDRDLRRLVGHVNMYDRLLDVLNAEETCKRDQSPPKSLKAETDSQCRSLNSLAEETSKHVEQVIDLVTGEKEMDAFGYADHFENVSMGSQEGYSAVSVAEVEILDDDA